MTLYTIITFSPVQGFIEKSRKLRDLYGSSFLLSYLAWIICETAEKHYKLKVISPALINVIQGTPNQIIIKGDFPEKEAKKTLDMAWKCVTKASQEWIEDTLQLPHNYLLWNRVWKLWTNHAWEFSWVQGEGEITEIRQLLNNRKYARDWIGINWQRESSTLSGADAIAYPEMDKIFNPKQYNYQAEKSSIQSFYQQLQKQLGESFIDGREELSLPELIKRIITHQEVANKLIEKVKQYFLNTEIDFQQLFNNIEQLARDLHLQTFQELNRHENQNWTGWFMGDGDKAGDYLKKRPDQTHTFSQEMRQWGQFFQNYYDNTSENCRVVYAGGDDFLVIFYDCVEGRKLQASYCIKQFIKFKSKIWNKPNKKPITVSVGFVWAGHGVPQRDVLQHCREAEKSAKSHGRDRIAIRILFNNGNYIEWVCPWWCLKILGNYQDRSENEKKDEQNWTHLYNDVATLESRHAFGRNKKENRDIALALIDIYFPQYADNIRNENNWWNTEEEYKDQDQNQQKRFKGGILGERQNYTIDNPETGELDQAKINQSINNWIINLSKIGFYLCQQHSRNNRTNSPILSSSNH